MKRIIGVGISLPKEFMEKIDVDRGDIPRSRYVLRLLEKQFTIERKKVIGLPDRRFQTLQLGGTISQ